MCDRVITGRWSADSGSAWVPLLWCEIRRVPSVDRDGIEGGCRRYKFRTVALRIGQGRPGQRDEGKSKLMCPRRACGTLEYADCRAKTPLWPNSSRIDWRIFGSSVAAVGCGGGPASRICCKVAFGGSTDGLSSESESEMDGLIEEVVSSSETSIEDIG